MASSSRGNVYSPVLQSILASGGQPFNLAGLAQATGLTTQQAYHGLTRLLDVGLVKRLAERRLGRRGRGERVYALVRSGEGSSSLLAKVAQIAKDLSDRRCWTTKDMLDRLGKRESGWPLYNPSSVRLALDLLDAQGTIAKVVEIQLNAAPGRGRVSQQWTSKPDEMALQRSFSRP